MHWLTNSKEVEAAKSEAERMACCALRKALNEDAQSINWAALVKASFHAGEANAYFRASNAVDGLTEKLKTREAKSQKSKD